ncbi:MAG: FAD-dependent thymidylate synthase [Candidatus Woesearchaeota archaeon]
MVDVKLAGFSTPVKILEELNAIKEILSGCSVDNPVQGLTITRQKIEKLIGQFTPEPLAAAWARISRDPRDINQLLEEALEDVPRARKSNETIIHGMGHHAAAHNAMFHYNITNISRLAVEAVEARRLAGYLEKSQRYVTLDGDFVRPPEYSPEDLARFEKLVAMQNEFYFKTNKKILEMLKEKNKEKLEAADEKKRKKLLTLLEGSAKEDARYALSLATKTQLGVSYDGETLEHAIRTLKYSQLAEEREIAQKMFAEAEKFAPSLIQLADAEIFKQRNPGKELEDNNYKNTRKHLKELAKETIEKNRTHLDPPIILYDCKRRENVALYHVNNAEERIIAALLFTSSNENYGNCLSLANHLMHKGQARDFVLKALEHIGPYDKVPREFEISDGLIYELMISSSGFGQLKRHRMLTLLPQDYDVSLGITVPRNVIEAGAEGALRRVCDKSAELYNEFRQKYGKAAEYCLTNAHKRRVLVGINLRELYHFSRTREDSHAQWEIRVLANKMSELAKETMPDLTVLLGGKDKFEEIRSRFYGA